ncbi:MAG: hypothetical protein BRC26_02905 [Nanohaloarchaea archaeon QH_8_44_6]|nr:MAG: hypothetical protein BRC26_02905 [Nanohaloarchaea archaeon QH_8_44_6]
MPFDFLKSDNKGENNSGDIIDDDFVELDAENIEEDQKVTIRAATLKEYKDVEQVQQYLRDDYIVWVNIKPLKNREMSDLKRAVNRLKKTVKAVNGDMAGVDEEWIVVCPDYATIERTEHTG